MPLWNQFFKNLTVLFIYLFPLVADIWFDLLVPEKAMTEGFTKHLYTKWDWRIYRSKKHIDFATCLLENVNAFEQMTLSLHTKISSISREWSERYEAIRGSWKETSMILWTTQQNAFSKNVKVVIGWYILYVCLSPFNQINFYPTLILRE